MEEGRGKMEEGRWKREDGRGKDRSKTFDIQPAMIFSLKFADNCGRIVLWAGQASQEGYGRYIRPRWA
jgi:hypothetical protein